MTDHFYSFVRVPVPVCLRVISVTSTVIISMSLEYNQQYMVIVFSSTLYCVILIAKDNLKMAALDLTMQPAAWTQNIALIVLPASWVWCSGTRLCEITVLQRWALWITVVLWKHVHGWKKKMLWKFEACHTNLSCQCIHHSPTIYWHAHEYIYKCRRTASSGGFLLETFLSPVWYCATIWLRLGIDLGQDEGASGGLGL